MRERHSNTPHDVESETGCLLFGANFRPKFSKPIIVLNQLKANRSKAIGTCKGDNL